MIICLCFVWTLLLGMNKCYDMQTMIKRNNDKYGMDMLNNDYMGNDIIFEINDNRNDDYESVVNNVVLEEMNGNVINSNVYLSNNVRSLLESDIISYNNYTLNITCTSFDKENRSNCLINKIKNVPTKNITNLTAVFIKETNSTIYDDYIYIHESRKKILEDYVNKRKNCEWIKENEFPNSHKLSNNNNTNYEIYRCDKTISLTKNFIIVFSPYIDFQISKDALYTTIDDFIYFNIVVNKTISSSDILEIGSSFIDNNKMIFENKEKNEGKIFFLITMEFSYSTINIFLSVFVIITSIILFVSSNCCFKKKFK